MIRRFLANAAALAAATYLLPGITVEGGSLGAKVASLLLAAALFGILNAVVKPFFKFVMSPLVLLTLGLFLIVINTIMLKLTSWVADRTGLGFHVATWLDAFYGSLIISVVSWVMIALLGRSKD